jgi:hypothetical protein
LYVSDRYNNRVQKFLKLTEPNSELGNSVQNKKQIESINHQINIYPNPANNTASVTFMENKIESYTIQVTDISGKILLQKSNTSTIGENKINLDISKFEKGTYIVYLINKEMVKMSLKLLKQ